MQTEAIILGGPRDLALGELGLRPPAAGEVVVEVSASGISTGTERLFWEGRMPPFPGMGYPLVPGYEATGHVVEGRAGGLAPGDAVFVPGSAAFEGARGLFGAAARRVVARADRLARIERGHGPEGALLALAATARHAIAGLGNPLPELIVGHGTLGRLVARLCVLAGGAPTVWEVRDDRRDAGGAYAVIPPGEDERRDYGCILDASGDEGLIDALIARLARGGELVLAGFYARPSFAFPPAFMREARIRVAAEWTPGDLRATRDLIEEGRLSLAGLVSHVRPAGEAPAAYAQAFGDPACLKMILDWEGRA